MSQETKTVQMTVRRVSFDEITKINDFMNDVQELSKELDWKNKVDDWEDYPSLKFLKGLDLDNEAFQRLINHFNYLPYGVAIFNLQTLLENCADLDCKHLDFSPKIQKGFAAAELLEKISKKIQGEKEGDFKNALGDELYNEMQDILNYGKISNNIEQ